MVSGIQIIFMAIVASSSVLAQVPPVYNCNIPGSVPQMMSLGKAQGIGFGQSATCTLVNGVCSCWDAKGSKCTGSDRIGPFFGSGFQTRSHPFCIVQTCFRSGRGKTSGAPIRDYKCIVQDWSIRKGAGTSMTPAPGVGRPAFTPHSQPPPPTSRRRAEEEMMGEPSTAAVAKAHASQPRAARPAQAPTRAATEPASSLDGEDF